MQALKTLQNELLINRPRLWMMRPFLLAEGFLLLMVLAIGFGIGQQGNQELMLRLLDTGIVSEHDADWRRRCGYIDDETEFNSCLERELPTPYPAAYSQLQALAGETGYSLQALLLIYSRSIPADGVIAFTIFIQAIVGFGWAAMAAKESLYTYQQRDSVFPFFFYYAGFLLLELPLLVYWGLVFPYPGLINELFVDISLMPLLSNFAVVLAISMSCIVGTANFFVVEKENNLGEALMSAAWIPYFVAAVVLLFRMDTNPELDGWIIASAIVVCALPIALLVVYYLHSKHGSAKLKLSSIGIQKSLENALLMLLPPSFALFPVWVLYWYSQQGDPQHLFLYSLATAIATLVLAIPLVKLLGSMLNRAQALPG